MSGGIWSTAIPLDNYNPLCAMAADLVIAEVEEVVPVGGLLPDEITRRAHWWTWRS